MGEQVVRRWIASKRVLPEKGERAGLFTGEQRKEEKEGVRRLKCGGLCGGEQAPPAEEVRQEGRASRRCRCRQRRRHDKSLREHGARKQKVERYLNENPNPNTLTEYIRILIRSDGKHRSVKNRDHFLFFYFSL